MRILADSVSSWFRLLAVILLVTQPEHASIKLLAEIQPPDRLRVAGKLASGRETVRIVGFGDSITGIYYHTGARRAWCDLLGIALSRIYPRAKIDMINAGISGNDSSQALKRVQSDVLDRRPDLVIVMFGMNDVVRIPPELYRRNLTEIVRQCRGAGAEVILMTPNSIYPEDPNRPVDRLAEYADIVREVCRGSKVPVADCYKKYEEIRKISRHAWVGLMSETIHPNLRGHRVFAEEAAWVISGKRVSLADVGPPRPSIPHTLSLLQKKQPVRVLAMKPYDQFISSALKAISGEVHVQVAVWDVSGKTLPEIEQDAMAKALWSSKPQAERYDLVIVAVPASAAASTDEQFYRCYSQILNLTLSYVKAEWDCIAILPSVLDAELDQAGGVAEECALNVIRGQDIGWIQRERLDSRPASEILLAWLKSQIQFRKYKP